MSRPARGDPQGPSSPSDGRPSADLGAADRSSFPPYLQSLLEIEVPLSVTLACKRQPLQRILELGPGSILSFDKLCTEPLTLEVAAETIAEGEVVKVGDKFGLRLTSMVMPEEKFESIGSKPRG